MATVCLPDVLRFAAAHRHALEVRVRRECNPDETLHVDHAGPER